ncbi:MAG TPA: phospholipase D-like domain-containing protein [Gemmatimonadales bacterium]|nr:phospholipase D-like domain-containing protein [Gemmatimonadales bacterium]HRZ09009.1 phospholipase D-like domain-containing protein [Gemmatimonadales bacterium]
MSRFAAAAMAGRALARAGGSRFIPGNATRLLVDGPEVFPAMLEAIRRAERWVHFENYIIRDDATGRRFYEALAERARAGVAVRVLTDWLGSRGLGRRRAAELHSAGVEFRRFNPPRLVDLLGNAARDHRKLVVTDAGTAIVGGLCIGDEWAGDPARGIQPWRDTAIQMDGPAAMALDHAFEQTWTLAGGVIPPGQHAGEFAAAGQAEIGVIIGEPRRARIQRIVELLAAGAVDRLWITDAYLVAPRSLFQSLLDAARGGVDVRLLVPGASDLPLIRDLTRIGYRALLQAGVRIFEWDGPMLHAKTIVVDGAWCRVGSSNLNPSSLIGNFELDVLLHDTSLGAQLEAQFRRDAAQSSEVQWRQAGQGRRFGGMLPGTINRDVPEIAPAGHVRRFREKRRRTGLALRGLATAARRSVFAPVALVLALLGLLFIVLPQTMALIVAGLCLWMAVGAGLQAFRRRTEQ